MSQFKFRPELAGYTGIECEGFVINGSGLIVPKADRLLTSMNGSPLATSFGPELSCCQIEWRTPPLGLDQQEYAIRERLEFLTTTAAGIGLGVVYKEIAPPDIPLDVYPNDRYIRIKSNVSEEVLRSGCRVAGVHVHVGMKDHEAALRAYNHARKHIRELIELGDGSGGERMRLYKGMTPSWEPPELLTWTDVHRYAIANGWENDPRSWWTLVRVSVHGTVEFRPFGSTCSVERIQGWTERCLSICAEAQ